MQAHIVSYPKPSCLACSLVLLAILALSGCQQASTPAGQEQTIAASMTIPPAQVTAASVTTEPTQTSGDYATSEQSLNQAGNPPGVQSGADPGGAQCPPKGITDFYNLCFSHELNFVNAEGMGFTVTPYKGSNCVLLALTSSQVTVVGGRDANHNYVAFKIDGDWDFANMKCTLKGQTLLNVSVYGKGQPPCRDKNVLTLTVFESWEKAPIKATCTSKRPSGDFHTNPVDVTIPVLDDRATDLPFMPITTVIRQEASAGNFSGYFIYEVIVAPGVDSEVNP